MNPLDNHPEIRGVLYLIQWIVNGIVVVLSALFGFMDWGQMIGSLLTSLAPLLAASNTPTPEDSGDPYEDDYLDEDDYEGEHVAEPVEDAPVQTHVYNPTDEPPRSL